MAQIREYAQVISAPGGRSFYSSLRRRSRRVRAPITPALKANLAKERMARQAKYTLALKDARDAVLWQATQLRKSFGGHSTTYYTQEILQRGRLERGRRKPSKWNAFLRQELKTRNAGMGTVASYVSSLNHTLQNYPLGSQNSNRPTLPEKLPRSGTQWTKRHRQQSPTI